MNGIKFEGLNKCLMKKKEPHKKLDQTLVGHKIGFFFFKLSFGKLKLDSCKFLSFKTLFKLGYLILSQATKEFLSSGNLNCLWASRLVYTPIHIYVENIWVQITLLKVTNSPWVQLKFLVVHEMCPIGVPILHACTRYLHL